MKNNLEVAALPDHSFLIQSEAELMSLFSEKDRKRVLPPRGVHYPIRAQHYFTWKESSGVYVYLLFKRSEWERPAGLVFKKPTGGAHLKSGRMCDWCISYGSADQVGMLMLKLNARQSIGVILCLDLHCADRLETAAELSGKSFEKLMAQLYGRIGKLYETVLRSRTVPELDPETESETESPATEH